MTFPEKTLFFCFHNSPHFCCCSSSKIIVWCLRPPSDCCGPSAHRSSSGRSNYFLVDLGGSGPTDNASSAAAATVSAVASVIDDLRRALHWVRRVVVAYVVCCVCVAQWDENRMANRNRGKAQKRMGGKDGGERREKCFRYKTVFRKKLWLKRGIHDWRVTMKLNLVCKTLSLSNWGTTKEK